MQYITLHASKRTLINGFSRVGFVGVSMLSDYLLVVQQLNVLVLGLVAEGEKGPFM